MPIKKQTNNASVDPYDTGSSWTPKPHRLVTEELSVMAGIDERLPS